MSSAIIYARNYWEIPMFNHYIVPVFNDNGLIVNDFHAFQLNCKNQLIFSLRGNNLESKIKKSIESSIRLIDKDNEKNPGWKHDKYGRPEWSCFDSILIDKNPEIIGMYEKDETASQLFAMVALGYTTKASEERIGRLIEKTKYELHGLGTKLSNI